MRLADFDYTLPDELVAQRPVSPRDASRLLVVRRETGTIEHRVFREIGEYLRAGDTLVVNDTRVLPARLRGRRLPGGGAAEVFLLRPSADRSWEALVRPGRRLRRGAVVEVGQSGVRIEIGERLADGRRAVRALDGMDLLDVLREAGEVPLPPYIHTPIADPGDYQTVYARADGAIAAPTAGLHFTTELMAGLRAQGIAIVTLTLHVGLGTFQRVAADDVREHRMDAEHYTITPSAAEAICARRGRVIAVGTSTVRALETAAAGGGAISATSGWTDLFIYPGFGFRLVEGMVTNFHLPRTTLLMLVSAFAGRELILRAYEEAIRRQYRFYSFGDAMLIV